MTWGNLARTHLKKGYMGEKKLVTPTSPTRRTTRTVT